jgi:cytochrome c-type biogenesis protein CcmE
MKARHKRLGFVGIGVLGLAGVAFLIFNALGDGMVFFFSPTDVYASKAPQGRDFRLGGLVVEESLKRENDGLTVHFKITDNDKSIPVTYTGILPDLFKEGQGVIAQGKLNDGGIFMASEVLAKHDETYMPPEVADALEKAAKTKAASTVVQN